MAWKYCVASCNLNYRGANGYRVIDVLKVDVESSEWAVLDNILETDVFQFVRQFYTEYHIFPDFPLPENYVHMYQVYTRLREIGLREYQSRQFLHNNVRGSFRYQADVHYVNAFFDKKNLGK